MKKKERVKDPWEDFFEELFGPFVLFGGLIALGVFCLPLIGIGVGIGYWIWG